MKKWISLCLMTILSFSSALAGNRTVKIRVLETTDVHGSFFPFDFINMRPCKGSMARVSTYVRQQRDTWGDNLLVLENGDILQGQPSAYFYNYVATDEENVAASITNFIGYNAQAFGNHDVEPGHNVYDKWVKETKAPTLGANIIDTSTGQTYVKPYDILVRDGVKIAILGMLTPAIPNWLDESLWSGLKFEEMVGSARKWVAEIQQKEHPDIIIGLFHAGRSGGIITSQYEENPVERIAREVPGIDIIFFGHDHRKHCEKVHNISGKDVWIINPANKAMAVGEADICFEMKGKKVKGVSVEGRIVDVTDLPIDEAFAKEFASQEQKIRNYVERNIGYFTKTINCSDGFFGSCAFTDFIQNIQLKLTGAQISLNAPLGFNSQIKEGDLHVSDMFNLYKYENKLCVLRMTGKELLGHLEMSYDMWVNTMQTSDDHIMLLSETPQANQDRLAFKNMSFNFDSAAGIDYEVDVTKPNGQKVRILRLSNGQPFDLNAEYTVAMNSYRASGGGELLTIGAGIPKEELKNRVVWESELDIRYYLMQQIEQQGIITPEANNNWKFVPEEWTTPAIARDREILFGK